MLRATDFDRLFAEHAQGLFAYLAYRTGDRLLAEDLTAETFEAAYRARRRFDRRRAGERTWLYAIALNLLRDHARRQGAEARAMDRAGLDPRGCGAAGGAEDERLTQIEDRDRLRAALTTLSAEERECVALRFGGDLTLKEIAQIVDEPITTVEGRVYRSLRKLRAELG